MLRILFSLVSVKEMYENTPPIVISPEQCKTSGIPCLNANSKLYLWPLRYAVLSGNIEMVKYLVNMSDINIQETYDKDGPPLLDVFYVFMDPNVNPGPQDFEIIEFLLSRTGIISDVELSFEFLYNLEHAVRLGYDKMKDDLIKQLLDHPELDINAKNSLGQSVLYQIESVKYLEYLLKKNINVLCRDVNGLTAFGYHVRIPNSIGPQRIPHGPPIRLELMRAEIFAIIRRMNILPVDLSNEILSYLL